MKTSEVTAIEAPAKLPHPPRRRYFKWVGIPLAILLLGGSSLALGKWWSAKNAAPAEAPPVISVKLQTIEPTQVEASSEFVGTLEAQKRVSLQPQIQGRIERVFVSSGDRVAQGTPVVSLSLDQTQAEVASATAAANSSRSAIGTAQAQLQAVAAEQVRAAADVRLQQLQFDRTEKLVVAGAQARQELDLARNRLETANATLQAAQKQVNASRALVNEATANFQESEANIASARVNLGYKIVAAPISGIIGDFSIKAGDYVTIGQTLTTVIQNNLLDMRISVPANNAPQLRQGLPVELLDANNSKRLTTGSISFVSPQVATNAQSILTKAQFANTNGSLRDGQSVRARIIWSNSSGILIPTTAINRIGGQSFVFVAQTDKSRPQKVVRQQPVTLGEVQGSSYQVIKGLNTGDRIAVSNIIKLRDGVAIQPES
ncbi:efflux RND transporter periplasmic adaptor subunit [Synechocystis sp. PCC 7509]|uniref:efflux RND transporter periplasmic adaptor subunit n=1 Tax=Synechocystis sp. PCC 7509 TaxID=927677 RepID=UPI0002ABAF17|nr:efflux RND transporter periplasmic adaptor subunit [Synechocystis sp. PCC 7509]